MRLTDQRVPAGFTLIEVLAAFVVLAVGLLGLERLMVDGLSGSRIARQHSQAVALAADMGERIRANGAGAEHTRSRPVRKSRRPPTTAPRARLARPPAWPRSTSIVGNNLSAAYCRTRETSIVTAVVGAGPSRQYDILIRWTQTGDDDPARFALTVQR